MSVPCPSLICWTGPGSTTASPDELLVAVDLPAPAAGTGSAYVRLEYRRQMEIAVVGATASVTLGGGTVTDARIAITALAPTIRRVGEAEAGTRRFRRGRGRDRGRRRSRCRRRCAHRRRSRIG